MSLSSYLHDRSHVFDKYLTHITRDTLSIHNVAGHSANSHLSAIFDAN